MKTTLHINGIELELNKTDFSAKIIQSENISEIHIIPRSIKYQTESYTIISIAENAFKNNENIKIISFSDDSIIRTISDYSFFTSSLEMITIPDSVTEIGSFSFAWCNSLRSVALSNRSKLRKIGNQAFFLSNSKRLKKDGAMDFL